MIMKRVSIAVLTCCDDEVNSLFRRLTNRLVQRILIPLAARIIVATDASETQARDLMMR